MTVPSDRKYSDQHEWLVIDGDAATIGITAFAADALGDVVHIELPAVGTAVAAGETCGEIESTKSVSDLYAPASGEVTEINENVADDPGVLNLDPYGKGWLFRMRVSGGPELLDAEGYHALTGEA